MNRLAPGKHTLVYDFAYDGGGLGKGGTGSLWVDGAKVAEKRIPRTLPLRVTLDEGFDVGLDTGTPVTEDYQVPFAFGASLGKVTIELR